MHGVTLDLFVFLFFYKLMFMKRMPYIYLLFLLSSLFACAQKETVLNSSEFSSFISKENVQVLDVRTAEEFETGYIKNAMLADWNQTEEFKRRITSLDKSKPVAVYCLAGGRSAKAAAFLKSEGFQVVELAGGMNAWNKAQMEVENAGKVAEMTLVEYENRIKSQGWVLVDVGAKWCPPCRQMEPIVTDFLGKNSEVQFLMVDGGKDKSVTRALNVEVMPTFILYKDGVKVWTASGIIDAEEFDNALKK